MHQRLVQLLSRYGRHSALGLSRAATDTDEGVRQAAEAALASLDVEVREGAILRGPKDKKRIALVFTGHEYAESGRVILDEMSRQQGHASFFLTGHFLTNRAFRPLVQRLYQEGHYLGPHSDRHLLYCSQDTLKPSLVTREEFAHDFTANLARIARIGDRDPLPGYFVPPYERYNLETVEWASEYFYITVGCTPGTLSRADTTSESDPNFVSSAAILESITACEQLDPHGLNGFILLFHTGAGPLRADKFHTRFGDLLNHLASRGYKFVAIDELFDTQAARQRLDRVVSSPPSDDDILEAFRRRYGLRP